MKSKERILSLQVLRALGCLAILAGHCRLGAGGPNGVSLFFLLSGFLTYYNNYDREIEDGFRFAWKHIRKLYPLHIGLMIVALAMEIPDVIKNGQMGVEFLRLIFHTFLLQSWIPYKTFYYSLNKLTWFLSTIVFSYMISPYILRWLNKKKRSGFRVFAYCLGMFAVMVVTAFVFGERLKWISKWPDWTEWFTYLNPIYRACEFLIGCFLGYIYVHRSKNDNEYNRIAATIIEIIAIIISFSMSLCYQYKYGLLGSTEWICNTLIYIPANSLLVYIFAVNRGWVSRILTNKAAVSLGNVSVYVFMFHQLILRMIRAYLPFQITNPLLLTIFLFSITMLTIAVYKYVFLEKLQKRRVEH